MCFSADVKSITQAVLFSTLHLEITGSGNNLGICQMLILDLDNTSFNRSDICIFILLIFFLMKYILSFKWLYIILGWIF